MDSAPTEFLRTNALLAQVFGHTVTSFIERIKQLFAGVFKAIYQGLESPLGRINELQYGGQLGLELQQGFAEYKRTYGRLIMQVVDRIEVYATRNVFKVDAALVEEGYFRLGPLAAADFAAPALDDEIDAAERDLVAEIAALHRARAVDAQLDHSIAAAQRVAAAMPRADPEDLDPLVAQLRTLAQQLQTLPEPAREDSDYLQRVLWSQ